MVEKILLKMQLRIDIIYKIDEDPFEEKYSKLTGEMYDFDGIETFILILENDDHEFILAIRLALIDNKYYVYKFGSIATELILRGGIDYFDGFEPDEEEYLKRID